MTNPRPSLSEYAAKRRRSETSEPFGPEPPVSSPPTARGKFVVHLHAARRTHCDLRLEVSGVLRSFAIPRGPSLSSRDKRLAVQTEDHPLSYLDFEGVIPAGSYGAGAMIAWDLGRVCYHGGHAELGLAQGKLEFELFGFKLQGRFVLIRTAAATPDHPQWLLLKKQDPAAREVDLLAEQPRSVLSGLTVDELERAPKLAGEVEAAAAACGATLRATGMPPFGPMLCSTAETKLDEPGYFYELKLDGARILAQKSGERVQLHYRSLRLVTGDYPEIVRAINALPGDDLVLDGEVVAFDEAGRPNFQRLSSRINRKGPLAPSGSWPDPPVIYLVFDLLSLGKRDLTNLPLSQRKALLRQLVRGAGVVRLLDHIEDDGRPLYAFCQSQHLEGIVKKRADSPYLPGPTRSGAWIKIKCERDEDFVVVGFTKGKGSRERCGALDLATYQDGQLWLRGRVGSGFDEATLDVLRERFSSLIVAKVAAQGSLEPAPRGRTFLKPEIVVRVRFLGWSNDGRLRHPVFLGIRDDLPPEQCTTAPPVRHHPAERPEKKPDSSLAESPGQRRRITVTHGSKIFWPEDGIRKRDLFGYYEAIAPTLLPYLRNRPVVLVRYPDGIAGKSFYQWNVPVGTPSWVRTSRIQREDGSGRRSVTVFLVDDIDTLLHIVNLGCIPIHILAHRTDTPDDCDFITFDFDPGPAPIAHVLLAAQTLHEMLEDLRLPSYPKSSGQSGMHVLVPLGPHISFDTARAMLALLGRLLESRCSHLATMERRVEKRGGKVYIDTGQTGPSRTIVAPYSVRARPGATVSSPLSWDEVGRNTRLCAPGGTMHEVLARVATQGDPMKNMLETRPDVPSTLVKLERLVQDLAEPKKR